MIDWHVQSEDSQYSVNLVYCFVPLNIDSLQVPTRYLAGIKHLCLAVGGPIGLLADAVVLLVIASTNRVCKQPLKPVPPFGTAAGAPPLLVVAAGHVEVAVQADAAGAGGVVDLIPELGDGVDAA